MDQRYTGKPASRLELVLSCEHDQWSAQVSDLQFTGDDLSCLEASIAQELQSNPQYLAQLPVDVHMRFDVSSLPIWLRQYQAHYFNYVLRVEAQRSPA